MIVISLFYDHAPAALANHRRYARMHGYRHIEIDLSDLSGSRRDVRWVYRYETLLLHLSRAQENECVLLLSENAAILRPAPLPVLLEGRDWLLACAESDLPQTDIQLWRNTARVRRKLFELVGHCRLARDLPEQEGALLSHFDAWPSRREVCGLMIAVPAAVNLDSVWAEWDAFAVCVRDERHHRRFRRALFEHIDDRSTRGLPLLSFIGPEPSDEAPRSVYNAGQPIAFVTLYTPNVASYGRIAEANFRRYCARHGYTLYVHRAIPPHLDDGKTSGNWLKPALLHEYLPHHEWVFWIDADVLFNDLYRPIETIIGDGDTVLARDIGTWTFNSGIMGFRRTQQNYDAFHHIRHACSLLDDRSDVYVHRGDQFYFTEQFQSHANFDATRVSSFIEWNTPWIFRRPDSFLVHYIGMWRDHKALLMDHDVGLSAAE